MLPKDTTITTTRCMLSIPDESDFDMIFSASRYDGFNDGMQWDPPQSKDDLWIPLQNSIKSWENGMGYAFTIQSKDADPIKYGRISIRVTEEKGKWNLGYWIHPQYHGRGLMTECVEGIVNFGFNTLNAHTITANVSTWNKASEKVILNNGFMFSHHIPQGIKKNGAWVAENGFYLTKSSWEKCKEEKLIQ
ncbi:MAG: GNAT family N-acetyltransferase [Saprospiraceae bacterium]|nr:GNAT family N-acetyltransferase [Saprospiraceae bacterium]